ncbi:hypothetical protein N9O85_02400, partial [Porticoccaceae bacterium]|nr:hypothetical protein [Porticoccaceae bacterium]
EQSDSDGSEETAFKADISLLRGEIKDGGFRTLGEYLASKPVHECEHIRTDRRMYMDELGLIFARQSSCHSILTEEVQGEIEDIIFFQRPLKLKKDRVGRCSLEPSKKRSAIARLEYQRFRYLQDINNLQYFCQNSDQWVRLNEADKEKLGTLFEVSEKLTFARIGKELGLQRGTSFNLDSGVKNLKGNTTSAAIREALPEWDGLTSEVQFSLVEDLISITKKSALKRRLMTHWSFTGRVALGLCLVELEPEHGQVSLKAIGKLMPHLVSGMIFSDARKAAGYGYEVAEIVAQDKLAKPPELPNPIVSIHILFNCVYRQKKNHYNQSFNDKVHAMPSRLGSTNKNKRFLLNRLQEMYGDDFHPILKMAENATTLHRVAAESSSVSDLKLSIDAWDKVAQYTEPKVKAIDIGLASCSADNPTEIILRAV